VTSDDLGFTRGDGCFEATRVVTNDDCQHRIDHLEEHLDRLQASCAALALPELDIRAWSALVEQVITGWDVPGEAILKLMLTRGRESTTLGPITGIATLTARYGLFGLNRATRVEGADVGRP